MAAEQMNRRDDTTTKERQIHVEKQKVPQLTTHFEAIAGPNSAKTDTRKQPEKSHDLSTTTQLQSLPNRVRDNRDIDTEQKGSQTGEKQQKAEEQAKGTKGSHQNQPSLEEISNYRATAQAKSNEAIRAAKERNEKSNKESLNQGVEDTVEEGGQQKGLETVKETLTSAAKTTRDYTAPIAEKAKDYTLQKALEAKDMTLSAGQTTKDYTAPIAEKAKDYTLQKAVEAKDMTVSTGQTTAHFLGEKAVAAKDAAIQSGKVAAEYAGKAAGDLKDKAAVAGWSTAHYSCDAAVEGTKAAARLVKGAAEYAAKPLSATGESLKDYTARKKEEAQRDSMDKEGERESMYGKKNETLGEGERIEEGRDDDGDGGILGAIGETLQEIAQTTKEMVMGGGKGDDETDKQSTLGFGVGQEVETEHYQTANRKGHTT